MEFLAGYVGGGSVELARVEAKKDRPVLKDLQVYSSTDYRDFDTILRLYAKKCKRKFSHVCLGVAGPVINNEVRTTNLPWKISASEMSAKFEIGMVRLVNDVVATAHGISLLDDQKFFQINQGQPPESGNFGLIAAGTGLGQALIYRENGHVHPFPSEGGHTGFAPGSELEMELLAWLFAERGQVEVEDVLSYAGLVSSFEFLLEQERRTTPKWFRESDDKSASVIERAMSGKDDTAVRTLELFLDCYASEAANLALKGMTLGGMYIGGMIAPQIVTAIDRARFMERFVRKGKMESLLAAIPVGIIIEERTALIGAAGLSLQLIG